LTIADTINTGYVVATDMDGFNSLNTTYSYVSAQFGSTHMPYKYDYIDTDPYSYPLLSEMVIKAIDILDNNGSGYFLMVEGGRIDHACHENNLDRCVWETRDFSFAVQAAVDVVSSDTLILVTADHETGGLHFDQGWVFSTTDHTAANVPVYAIGPNAGMVDGIMDNTDMFTVCGGEVTEPPVEEIYYAIRENTARGTVQNDYTYTYESDGFYEVIQ
jgi:alkaline phosphatase